MPSPQSVLTQSVSQPPTTIDWQDVFLRNPRKFTSELIESAAQCAIWQYVSDILMTDDSLNFKNWKSWLITSSSSTGTVLIRGVVTYLLESLKKDHTVDTSGICLDTVVGLVTGTMSSAVWQPAYDFAVKEEPDNTPMHFFITGALSAIFYFITLMLCRAFISIFAKKYRQTRWTKERLAKDIAATLFQVMPVAAYFVQTNGDYLISVLKTTNSSWLDAARGAACGAIGYVGGYFVRALIYFLSYALPYALRAIQHLAIMIYEGLQKAVLEWRRRQQGYQAVLTTESAA